MHSPARSHVSSATCERYGFDVVVVVDGLNCVGSGTPAPL